MIDPADKTLIIESLRVSDQGVYICEGENAVGSARALAQVSVNCKWCRLDGIPRREERGRGELVVSVMIFISLKC